MNNQKSEFEILQEDDDIIVCYKPAGIATQTKRLGQQDMESLLKNYRAQKGETPYIGVIHRLDQPVEGLMVFAKNQKAASHLSNQVQSRSIGKHYLAIAPISPSQKQEGVLEDYLLFDKRNNTTKVALDKTPQAKLAKLSYQVRKIKYVEQVKKDLALYDILLHTGRHHQIRVQFSNMGCPLWGDTKYASAVKSDKAIDGANQGELQGLALCSYRLEFVHPTSGKMIDVSIEPKNPIFTIVKEEM